MPLYRPVSIFTASNHNSEPGQLSRQRPGGIFRIVSHPGQNVVDRLTIIPNVQNTVIAKGHQVPHRITVSIHSIEADTVIHIAE